MKKLLISILMIFFLISCNDEIKQKKVEVPHKKETQTIVLPEYYIQEIIKKVDGSMFADIIIPKLSKEISADSLSKIIFAIAKKESISDIAFYRTKEAVKAAYSSSYAKKHPKAVSDYIGQLKNRRFVAN